MKPYQQPHPPIAVAASTPHSNSIRMAGERGWIPMSSSLLSRLYLRGHWRLIAEGAAAVGRAVYGLLIEPDMPGGVDMI